MKIPSRYVRVLIQLFCLLGIMSCQTRKPTTETAPINNHGKPEPTSPSDMRTSDKAKEKM